MGTVSARAFLAEGPHLPVEADVRRRYHLDHLGDEIVLDLGPTGAGKTERMLRIIREALDRRPNLRVLILVPTHALGRSLLARLKDMAPDISAALWLGWDAVDPATRKPFCHFDKLVQATQNAGGDPKALCQSAKRRCPHADTCPLFQQRRKENVPTVQIAAHAVAHHRMTARAPFDMVFIDEDVISTALVDSYWYPDSLSDGFPSAERLSEHSRSPQSTSAHPVPGLSGDELRDVLFEIQNACRRAALKGGPVRRADLPSIPRIEALRSTLYRMLKRPKPPPVLNNPQQEALLEYLENVARDDRQAIMAERMLEQLLCILCNAPEEEVVPGIRAGFTTTQDQTLFLRTVSPMPFDGRIENPGLMTLLSATARPKLYRRLFREVLVDRSHADDRPPSARYHLIPRTASVTSLFEDGDVSKPTRLLHDIGNMLIAKARLHSDEAVGAYDGYLVAQKDVSHWLRNYVAEAAPDLVDHLEEFGEITVPVLRRLELLHFNALAGLDRLKQVRFGMVVGRPQPRLQELLPRAEALARRCLLPDGEGEFGFKRDEKGGSWINRPFQTEVAGAKVRLWEATAENEILDDLLRSSCHAEVVQAIGRARANRRPKDGSEPLDLYVINALDLGDLNITYDSVTHLRQEVSWYHAMADLGVVPDLQAKSTRGIDQLAAAMLHDRFDSPKAVSNHRGAARRRAGVDEAAWAGTEGWSEFETQRAQLRLPGLRYMCHVLVRADTPDDVPGVIEKLTKAGHLPEGTEIQHVYVRSRRTS